MEQKLSGIRGQKIALNKMAEKPGQIGNIQIILLEFNSLRMVFLLWHIYSVSPFWLIIVFSIRIMTNVYSHEKLQKCIQIRNYKNICRLLG